MKQEHTGEKAIMLKSMRKSVQSTFVKVFLFGILIISFGLWGVTDLFVGNPQQQTVASVAGEKLDFANYNDRFQREIEQSGLNNSNIEITPELGRFFEDRVLSHWAIGVIMQEEVERLRLTISDEELRFAISSDPTFRDAEGGFSRRRFENFLASRLISEADFLRSLRTELSQNTLLSALLQGFQAPDAVAALHDRYQNTYRSAQTIEIVASPLMQIPESTEAQLREYFTQQQEQFRLGEHRVLAVIPMSLQEIASGVAIPEEQLIQYYEDNQDQFLSPESRSVERILFDNEDDARRAWVELQDGKDFVSVAAKYTDLDMDSVKLGSINLGNFADQALAEAAFRLEPMAISEPLQGLFGWMVLRVTEIIPEHLTALSEVREQFLGELQREQAADKLFDYVDQVEDLLASGANIEEIATEMSLNLQRRTVDMQTFDENSDALLLSQAASLEDVGDLRLFEGSDGGYRVIALQEIIESTIPPLDNIRQAVEISWRESKQRARALQEAQALAERLNRGEDMQNLAGQLGLKLIQTAQVNRDGQINEQNGVKHMFIPPETGHISALFTLNPDVAVALPSRQGAVVMRLLMQSEGMDANTSDRLVLHNQLATEVFGALQNSLRLQYPLKIDPEVVAQMYVEPGTSAASQ